MIDRINKDGVEVPFGCDAANVRYNGGSVKDALDGIGQGGSGVAVHISNDDDNAYNLQKVFYRTLSAEDVASIGAWQYQLENFFADESVSVTQLDQFKVYIEVKSSGGPLGANGMVVNWANFFSRINGYTWAYRYDGDKDIYIGTSTVASATGTSIINAATGASQIKLPTVTAGQTVMIAAYVEYKGKRFYCRSIKFSATANASTLETMPHRHEWPSTAVTADKVNALIDEHMMPYCSAGSEYDPFMAQNTTPRVIVTIMSDDAEINDFVLMHQDRVAKVDAWNEAHPDSKVDIRMTYAVPSNLAAFTRADNGNRMTADMIRGLVGNYGDSIMCHGYNHEVIGRDITTNAEVERMAANGRRQIERKIGVPCIHFCRPGGGYNSTDNVLKRYFLTAALIESSETLMPDINTQSQADQFNIKRVSCYSNANYTTEYGTTGDGIWQIDHIKKAAEYVAQNNESAWIVFYTHGQNYSNETHKNRVNVLAVIDYCLANGIPMRNYSEAYAEMFPPVNRLKQLLGLS